MKMGSFVVGGLLGAAAVMYLNSGNRQLKMSSLGGAGQMIDNMVDKARSRMMNPDHRSYYGGTTQSNASGGLNQVEKIIKEDPALEAEVSQIIKEGETSSSASL